jgi:2-amino-4-hydroxy-6-hydroxymethyldihydropteridine diphosphokinase
VIVYLALGSNLGDREQYLRSAIRGLSTRGVQVIRSSSVYLTEPREILEQPWFLNAVVECETSLEPALLLETCRAVEAENARLRDVDKGPRTLDIDIIFYGNAIVRKPGLLIPHPRFSERRFVLAPLAEIAPQFIDPIRGLTVQELLERTSDSAEVRRTAEPLLQ